VDDGDGEVWSGCECECRALWSPYVGGQVGEQMPTPKISGRGQKSPHTC